jgi:hypothetical protein
MECWCENIQTGTQDHCRKPEKADRSLKVLACWVDAAKMSANTYDVSYFE